MQRRVSGVQLRFVLLCSACFGVASRMPRFGCTPRFIVCDALKNQHDGDAWLSKVRSCSARAHVSFDQVFGLWRNRAH